MKFTSAILLFVFVQGLSFSACGASPPAGVLQDLSGRSVPGNEFCHRANLAADGEEACIIQDLRYSKEHTFQHVSGCSCFRYMNGQFINPNSTIRFGICWAAHNTTFPCFWNSAVPNIQIFPFHYNNERAVKVLKEAFSNNGIHKWRECAEEAMKCCNNMKQEDLIEADGYCTANWDGWTCLDKWPVQKTQHKPCPDYIYVGNTPSCTHYSNKVCNESGLWSITASDYSTCPPNTMLQGRYLYHAIMLSVSIAVALPAIIIFFSYRKLWVTRMILHRNLVTAIVIQCIFSIVVKMKINTDALFSAENAMTDNPVWCRAVSFMEKLSTNAVYSCFLLEGIFLHRLISGALKGEPHMLNYYIGATGLALFPMAVWTVLTVADNNIHCWVVEHPDYSYMFILDGPRIFTLVVNVILMLDIVRVLCTKMRNVNSVRSNQTRRMIRATILLIPLFGVHILVTLQRPETDDCFVEQVYYYFFYAMDGLQGALVALLYCYLNKEVQVQVLRTYSLLQVRIYHLLGKEYNPHHRSTWAYSEQKTNSSVVRADEVTITDAPLPSKNSYARNGGPLVSSVSDIVATKDRAQ